MPTFRRSWWILATAMVLVVGGCAAPQAASELSLHLPASAKAPAQESYMVVLLDGKKIGHAYSSRTVDGDKVVTVNSMDLALGRAGFTIHVKQEETDTETATGQPLGFVASEDLGMGAKTTQGTMGKDGKLHVEVTGGLGAGPKVMDWPKGAVLNEGARLISLAKGLKEGTRYTVSVFECSSLRAWEGRTTVGKRARVDLLGRVVELTETRSVIKSDSGTVNGLTYVDDDLDAQKVITPLLGMNLEMIACSRKVALSANDTMDFFTRLLVPSPVRIDDPAKARSIRFSLAPTRQGPLAIPDTDNQKVVRGGDGTLTVTVAPVRPAGGQAIRYAGHDKAALAMLKPGKYVQSDDPRIVVLARKAVGDARDAAEAIARIEDFTRKYITKKDLSVGYASASEVVVGKEGDCTEHAVFAAALCRAAGIPARVVCGLGYINPGRNNGIFGPHAWVEAFIGGKWVGLDAALNGYDASHLTLTTGSGDPDEFFDITNTLGCFKIARIDVQR